MPQFDRLKGFRDFYPGEQAARDEVFRRVEGVVERYGFRRVDTPSLESLDLFLVKSGEELVEQTYSFADKGGRDVTMIPEQTPGRARMIAANKALSTPIKWYDTSKRWRYESPQKGRLREFYQTDIDIFGVDSVQADAEILAVAADIMAALDVQDAVHILVNDRRLLEGILTSHGIDAAEDVMQVIDDREKMTAQAFRDELQACGLSGDEAANVADLTAVSGPIDDVLPRVRELAPEGEAAAAALDRMGELRDALAAYDVADDIRLDLSIVRGLAYYTGLVFEVFDEQGDLRAVCGGGRYDELVEEFMKREGVWPAEQVATDYYVLPVSDGVRDTALEIVAALRDEGHVVEVDLTGRNVGNQFDYADSINADRVVVVGERDLEQGEVTVKDMATGEEEAVPLDQFLDR